MEHNVAEAKKTDANNNSTEKKHWYLKLKERWGVSSDFQVFLIFVVFGLTGSTVVYVKGFFFQIIGFDAATPGWIKTVTYLLFIFPAYQALLLIYAFIFGQFDFFWAKMKKMGKGIKRLFGGKKSSK
ncbi:DUF6787 family protein [Microscilla marina]|uniref:DUF6787 domain-containing protein n=1 Tax=Microscilla marina ATCC 23134 TaxID=313606 RepID=A1ZND4_MICM2|nr:DUF6787 family protein [Microscilla marina]EAY28045.1 hypothetical protein M23134_02155 [Microscilla marina ATCC 23134]